MTDHTHTNGDDGHPHTPDPKKPPAKQPRRKRKADNGEEGEQGHPGHPGEPGTHGGGTGGEGGEGGKGGRGGNNPSNGGGRFGNWPAIAMPLVVVAIGILTTWVFKIDERTYLAGSQFVTRQECQSNVASLQAQITETKNALAAQISETKNSLNEVVPTVKSNTDWRAHVEAELEDMAKRLNKLEADNAGHDRLDEEAFRQLNARFDRYEQRFQSLVDGTTTPKKVN